MEIGKKLRMRRFFEKGRTVIVPLDHPLYSGPVKGVEDPVDLVQMLADTEADGILVTPGILKKVSDVLGNLAVALRIDGTHTRLGSHLERIDMITTVEEGLRLGAEMAVINVFVGTENEDVLLRKLGTVATACSQWGMPLMAEMIPASLMTYHYGQGGEKEVAEIVEDIKLVTRLGAEIGADVVKTHYVGPLETYADVIRTATIPVVIAGGPKFPDEAAFISFINEVAAAGVGGICMGRNIWGAKDPQGMLQSVCRIVHGETRS